MATPKTQYQRNKAKIDRPLLALQNQLNQAREQYNTEYTGALADYQAKLDAYNLQSKEYEDKFAAYKVRAETYNEAVKKYNQKTPLGYRVGELYQSPGNYWLPDLAGKADRDPSIAQARSAISGFGGQLTTPGVQFRAPGDQFVYVPDTYNKGGSYGTLYKRAGKDPGTFTEVFTEEAPVAPGEPDVTAAKAKFAEAETTYSREVAERKAGRLRARMRTTQRPMLNGAA